MQSPSAVIVLSGGQDSMTVLAFARHAISHLNLHAISFSYGQRHIKELAQAREICELWNIRHCEVALPLGDLVTSALTGPGDVGAAHPRMSHLPASFVPNRNALFLTYAHAFAQEKGAKQVYGGMCQTDYSGYPDCRAAFIDAMEDALNIGYDANIKFCMPLMYKTKAQTFEMAWRLGVLAEILEYSHTCYNGDREHRHIWGYGCGGCPACKLREKGFNEWLASTPETANAIQTLIASDIRSRRK